LLAALLGQYRLAGSTPSGEQLLDLDALATYVPESAIRSASNDLDSGNTPLNLKSKVFIGTGLDRILYLLVIEQAYVVHTDFRWVVSENGIPFNHSGVLQAVALRVDANPDGTTAIPVGLATLDIDSGALTASSKSRKIPSLRNWSSPRPRPMEKSLKAALWNALQYAVELGPISEVTGRKIRLERQVALECEWIFSLQANHCYTGVGQIDIVMTRWRMGWLIGEDFLDKKVVRGVSSPPRTPLD